MAYFWNREPGLTNRGDLVDDVVVFLSRTTLVSPTRLHPVITVILPPCSDCARISRKTAPPAKR